MNYFETGKELRRTGEAWNPESPASRRPARHPSLAVCLDPPGVVMIGPRRWRSVLAAASLKVRHVVDPLSGETWWHTEWKTSFGLEVFEGGAGEIEKKLRPFTLTRRLRASVLGEILDALRESAPESRLRAPGLYLLEGRPVANGLDTAPPAREELRETLERLSGFVGRLPSAQREAFSRLLSWSALAPYGYTLKLRGARFPDAVCVAPMGAVMAAMGSLACAVWGIRETQYGATLKELYWFGYDKSRDTRPLLCENPHPLPASRVPEGVLDAWRQSVFSAGVEARCPAGAGGPGKQPWARFAARRSILFVTEKLPEAIEWRLQPGLFVVRVPQNAVIPSRGCQKRLWAEADDLAPRLEALGRAWAAYGWLADTARGEAYRETVLSAQPDALEAAGRACWRWLSLEAGCENLFSAILGDWEPLPPLSGGVPSEDAVQAFFHILARGDRSAAGTASGEEIADTIVALAREGRHAWLKIFPNGDLLVTREIVGEMRRALGEQAPRSFHALGERVPSSMKYNVYAVGEKTVRGIRIPPRALVGRIAGS